MSTLLFCDSLFVLGAYIFSCFLMVVLWLQSQFHTCCNVFGYFVPRLDELATSRSHENDRRETLLLSTFVFCNQRQIRPETFDTGATYLILTGIFWRCILLTLFSQNAFLGLIQRLNARVMFRVRKPFILVRVHRVSLLVSVTLCLDLSHSFSLIPKMNVLCLSFRLSPRVSFSLCLSFSLSLVPILVISLG